MASLSAALNSMATLVGFSFISLAYATPSALGWRTLSPSCFWMFSLAISAETSPKVPDASSCRSSGPRRYPEGFYMLHCRPHCPGQDFGAMTVLLIFCNRMSKYTGFWGSFHLHMGLLIKVRQWSLSGPPSLRNHPDA